MEHISNEEKAKHIAANLVFELIEPLILSKEQRQQIEFKMYYALIEMAEWKDEQHAKEKQTLIQKYEDKLNKLNQREEVIRDNVRRANSRYGFEGLF